MSLETKQETGFTLVEMLCTCSILGLMLTLAIPDMSRLIDQATQVQLRHQIKTQLEHAQLEAMAKETETLVQFTNEQIITRQGEQIISQIVLPKDVQVTSNYSHNQVVFQETGQVRGGTIAISQQGYGMMKIVIQVASGTTKVIIHE
jgi:prepilin-type N-terminal cleavage/methylation domain-containing protein